MGIIGKKIESLKTVLEWPLSIPDYQRPYKWDGSHVNQLIDDLLVQLTSGKSSYRLGTIVLQQDRGNTGGALNIVDGQQRLITLTLLCGYLDELKDHCIPSLLQHKFISNVSVENLKHSAAHIKRRVDVLAKEQRFALQNFFFNQCELVCVTLEFISEAFQFFDSQNARGKGLEPYDLLKAFHLREMRQHSPEEQTQCVKRWESQVALDPKKERVSVDDTSLPSLHELINKVLFRIRQWVHGESALFFSGKTIAVFKGVNHREHLYRHSLPLRAVDCAVAQYNADPVRLWDGQQMEYPFQSDQTLLNGKRFFDYIEHYTRIYQTLFIKPNKELDGIQKKLNSYKGCHRIGDAYVKNLFFCTVLYYYDKFGDHELDRVARLCLAWSYRLRLEQASVREESIDRHARASDGLFKAISKAVHPHEILTFPTPPLNNLAGKVDDEFVCFLQGATP